MNYGFQILGNLHEQREERADLLERAKDHFKEEVTLLGSPYIDVRDDITEEFFPRIEDKVISGEIFTIEAELLKLKDEIDEYLELKRSEE